MAKPTSKKRKHKRSFKNQDQLEPAVWTERLLKRMQKLIEAGDEKGVRKLKLGRFICMMRLNAGYTQQEAAESAEMTRVAWNRIEMGRTLPRRVTLEVIADVIRTDVNRLLQRAGYARPKVPIDQIGSAFRRFRTSLEQSSHTVHFLMDMCLLWQEFKAEEFGIPKKKFELNTRIPEAIAYVKTLLPIRQQLQLAVDLVHSLSPQEWGLEQFSYRGFIQLVDQKIAECRIDPKTVPRLDGA